MTQRRDFGEFSDQLFLCRFALVRFAIVAMEQECFEKHLAIRKTALSGCFYLLFIPHIELSYMRTRTDRNVVQRIEEVTRLFQENWILEKSRAKKRILRLST